MAAKDADYKDAVGLYSRPLTLFVIYIVVGGLWAVSDMVLRASGVMPAIINRFIFVAITAILFYFVIRGNRRALGRLMRAEREKAARIKGYFRFAAQALVVLDRRGRIVETNEQARRMFGYGERELIGRPSEILAPERLRDRHIRLRTRYLHAPRSRSIGAGFDLAARRKDGSEFPIEISLSFVETAHGGLVTCFITDVTERRSLELSSRRSETMAAIGTMAAGVAHELNNPLAIISARAELVMTEAANLGMPEQALEDLRVIFRNAQRASRVATQLLTLARRPLSVRKPLNVNDLVNSTLLFFREQATRDRIRIDLALDGNVRLIMGDETALEQVLINLLRNAHDAMPDGGVIRIDSGDASDRDKVRLVVSDNGTGMSEETAAKVFDLFYTTKNSGTGLGLWLSSRTVREHGGTIEVESGPGGGTSFIMEFPAVRHELTRRSA